MFDSTEREGTDVDIEGSPAMSPSAAHDRKTELGRIEVVYRSVLSRWPGLDVPYAVFARCLSQRDPELLEVASRERAVELYLVCACLLGVPAAIKILELEYIEPVLAASGARTVNRDDLRQTVLERLLSRRHDGSMRLEGFSARSSLRTWLRVVAKRSQLNLVRAQAGEPRLNIEDTLETRLVAVGSDPELDYLRLRYAHEFSRAFRASMRGLDSRDKLMLRMHLVEGAGGNQVASILGVNRATIVRWMADVRKKLLAATRRQFEQELCLSRTEFESVVRVALRQIDLSLSALDEGQRP